MGKISKCLKNYTTARRKVINGVREDVYFWFDGDVVKDVNKSNCVYNNDNNDNRYLELEICAAGK